MRRFASDDGRFAVQVPDEVWSRLCGFCEEDFPRETGGILVGYYTPDHTTAVVTEALGAPPDSLKAPTRFERGTEGMNQALRRLWRRPAFLRRYYLGEWHHHPRGTTSPSTTDDRQMASIARGLSKCPEPVLLIVGGSREKGWKIGCWVYPMGKRVPLR